MSRIFWDTHLFLYLFEDTPRLGSKVATLRRRMLARHDQLFTSALTWGELLVKPIEAHDAALVEAYERAVTLGASIVSIDQHVARRFAEIRQQATVGPADALQLAAAAQIGVDLFVAHDDRLAGLVVPGVQFINSLDLVQL
jgi:predicted nucleic acid-binding protein